MLGLFNLIPIPPTDGSKIVGAALPDELYYRWSNLERYGVMPFIIIIFGSMFIGLPIVDMLVFNPAMSLTRFLLG
jgi:Zn-dependent protease